ncbi:MAG: hypothetical protein ACJ72H_28570 [Candidatus Sulfotelmatobacter sp.]
MNPAIRYVLSRKPRSTQVEAFAEIADQLTDSEYWRLAGHIWARHLVPRTAVYFYAALWHEIFQSPRLHRTDFSRYPADRRKWERMGDEITCYRGCGADNARGVFYSLDHSIAEVHARVWHGSVRSSIFTKAQCVFFGGVAQEVIFVPALLLSRYLRDPSYSSAQ